jgi:hypothetical protein
MDSCLPASLALWAMLCCVGVISLINFQATRRCAAWCLNLWWSNMNNSPELNVPQNTTDFLLLQIKSIDRAVIAQLRSVIATEEGFEFDEPEVYARFAALASLDASQARVLLGIIRRLYYSLNDDKGATPTPQGVRAALSELRHLPKLETSYQQICVNLAAMIAPIAEVDNAQNLARLEIGFLPNAVGFASFVDLRPHFSRDKERIEGFVPICQLRIETLAQDGQEDSLVFQISESGLLALENAIQQLRKKLNIVGTVRTDGIQATKVRS